VTYGRLAPKEQKLLGSSHLIMINSDLPFTSSIRRMDDAGFEQDQGNGGYTASVWFHGSVTPFIVPIESAED
jgi:hypothetical protein